MGTMVSLRYPDDALSPVGLDSIEQIFAGYDRQFSLYDPASPLSRVARGELALSETERRIRDAYALAIAWRNSTGGLFTPHRPDGVVDLSGVVKAMAIRDAGGRLDEVCRDWLVTVGGDVLSRGLHRGDLWRVGIVDPRSRDTLLGVAELDGRRAAMATSGTAERGEHIWRQGRTDIVQATVAAADIITADVLATALVAGDELERVAAEHDVEALVVYADGRSRATPGARAWIGR